MNQLKRKELGEILTYLDPAFGNKDRGNIRGLYPNLVPCDSNLGERNFECSFLRFCARLLTQIHCRPIFCPNLVLQVCSGGGGSGAQLSKLPLRCCRLLASCPALCELVKCGGTFTQTILTRIEAAAVLRVYVYHR